MNSCYLALGLRAFFKLRHFLTLLRRGSDFLAQDDVPDLTSGQRCNIDTVTLAKVLLE